MKMRIFKPTGQALLLAMTICSSAQQPSSMEKDFQNPPDAAKPRVWWHWMSGNVSKEGITADLEWMHRVGIGGMQMFDGDLGVAQYLDKPVIWMTPEWKAALRHAGAEADRLGLDMSMAASGGWSETAGPWVKPEEAMKKAVWSETMVSGPTKFLGKLAQPPRVNGPFQGLAIIDVPNTPMVGGAPGIPRAKVEAPPPDPTFYADTFVLAYRVPSSDNDLATASARITSSDTALISTALTDGDYATTARLNLKNGATSGWIQWDFSKPSVVRSFTLGMAPPVSRQSAQLPNGDLSYSNDGATWTKIVKIPDAPPYARPFGVRTFAFAPVTARYFRLTMEQVPVTADQKMRGILPAAYFDIAEVTLSASRRINFFEDKASFGTFVAAGGTATPAIPPADAIQPSDIVNLTSKMRADGTLDWEVPAGQWVILRMGYSLTGKKNHPATPAATGFEVDKLSKNHVTRYLQTYTGMISSAVAPFYGKSFRSFLMDSWEAGQENWTEDIVKEFERRRGYDPIFYLPTLTGRVVGSAEQSDGFLWDYRRTIAEMLADNHYKLADDFLAKQRIGLYAEAMGIYMPTTGDGLLNKGQVTIPMGEFWTPLPDALDTPMREADVLEAASAAHIYGKPIVATESFTSVPSIPGWAQSPFYLKQLADQNFARGVNRIVFHTSDHQPWVDDKHKPGITLGYFGQHYSRNITWAEQAVAWNTYLARCSYMLQRGKPIADVAYFYGEGAPVTVPYWKKFSPVVPSSFSFDYLNSDVLLNQASVIANSLALKSGMRYRVLVIPDEFTTLSLPVVRKLSELIQAGAIVVAPRVTASPSLADRKSSSELPSLASTIWGSETTAKGSRNYGKGKVYWGSSLEEVLAAEHIEPDFTHAAPVINAAYEYPVPRALADIVWTHRQDAGTDIYFVANQKTQFADVLTTFRVSGKAVELWHPDSGTTEAASYREENGKTVVDLHLPPEGSVFVLFRGTSPKPESVYRKQTEAIATLSGSWKVSFPSNLGAPPQIEIPSLRSWSQSTDPGVKYFSGTATYSKDFDLADGSLPRDSKVILDLGRVREIAELVVNGISVPTILWKPPFAADITSTLKTGRNHLEVKVTNLWPNRIIGDQQPATTQKYTFTVYGAYTPDSPLMESGLIGPVTLVRVF